MNEDAQTILIVDDDSIFRTRLTRAFTTRGYATHAAASAHEGVELARQVRPHRALVDLKMPGMGGLDLLSALLQIDSDMQVIVLTGYGSIATAVDAVHRGAIDYLTKPCDTEQILSAFARYDGNGQAAPVLVGAAVDGEVTPSLARVEYEHIQRILNDCGGNISAAARKLGIHRRSLQRKLGKLPPLE